jgi:hypothetical protein
MTIAMENQASMRAHKGLGIASFITGMFCLVLIVLLFGYAGMMTNAGKATPELNMIIGFGLFFAWFIDVIGIGLGIAAALDRSSKKVFPVLGLTVSVGILLLSVTLVVIGIAMNAR